MTKALRKFYEDNPAMVSSPFGGRDTVNAPLLRGVLASLDISLAGCRVLDVGCGRGFTRAVIEEMGGSYTGADFVVSGSGFPLVQADAARLPFADRSFDAVLCIDAFEHFPDPVQATKAFRRVLREGGFVFMSAPNYANVAGLVKKWCEATGSFAANTWAPFGHWAPQEWETFLTPRAVRRYYGAAGFRKFRARGHADEVELGLFPWIAHPRMPERLLYRMQGMFRKLGPGVVKVWPAASLHLFWRIEV